MGAPIWINNNKDLWISNGMKDAFCRVLTSVATLEGHDAMAVYTDAPGVAGTYGVSGLGIDLDEFNIYLGGPEGVRRHLGCLSRTIARSRRVLRPDAAARRVHVEFVRVGSAHHGWTPAPDEL
jgi:hypothetical protein